MERKNAVYTIAEERSAEEARREHVLLVARNLAAGAAALSKRPAAAQARIQMKPMSRSVMRKSCFKMCSSLQTVCRSCSGESFLSLYDRLVREMIHGQTGMSVLS